MHLFLLRIKSYVRNKGLMFWTFLYPILLGTFFYLGFGTLSQDSLIQTTPVYLAHDAYSEELHDIMKEVMIDEETPLFNVSIEYSSDELETKLLNQEIKGYIVYQKDEIIYRMNDNGLDQTIIKSFLDEYRQIDAFIREVAKTNPEKVVPIIEQLNESTHYFTDNYSNTNASANKMIIYFYALIAMTCLMGSFWGLMIINDIQANQSTLAARTNVTPTHKFHLILIYFLSSLLFHFLSNILLLLYLKYILGIDFANQMGLILLVCFVGTICGISLGALISGLFKSSWKEGMSTLITLFLSFLAGLMNVDIKYLVTKHVPFLGYINPANLITEALYSLYYYDHLSKYMLNVSLLAILSIIMIVLSYFMVRRKKYDSI